MTEQKQYPSFVDFRKGEDDKPAFGALMGYTTRELELRYTNTGKAVASTGVALNLAAKHLNYVLGTNFADDEVIFVDVTAWEKTGEIMSNANIGKGTQVVLSGTLALEEYQGKPKVRMNVNRFQITRRKNNGASQNQTQNQNTLENVGEPLDIGDDDLPF